MAQSPDYKNYSSRVAENATVGALKEGEYQAVVKRDPKKAKKYFRASGSTSKNEEKAIKESEAAGRRTVAMRKVGRKKGRKRGSRKR